MILSLTRDLMFSTKIKELCRTYGREARTVRDIPSLESALKEVVAELVIFDLNSRDIDVFAGVSLALATNAKTLGFFSHVDEKLKHRANELGMQNVVPRSRLERELSALLA